METLTGTCKILIVGSSVLLVIYGGSFAFLSTMGANLIGISILILYYLDKYRYGNP